MRYKLHEKLALRGWSNNTYGLRDLSTGYTMLLNEDAFHSLSYCNGIIDCDSFLIPENYRRIIERFAEKKFVKPCCEGEFDAVQTYREYPCNFIQTAHWSITGKCNMRCRHCYMSAPQAKFGELPLEKCLDIIEQFEQAGIAAVNLTGGEPLVREDFLDLVKALKEKNIAIGQIYTNGMLVNQRLIDNLKEIGVDPEFLLSFDGVGWHDWLRGIDGAEAMTVKTIGLLVKNGYDVGIESVFHRDSIDSIIKTMHLLVELGVSHWKINPISKSGNWLKENRDLDLTLEELYDAYLKTIKAFYDSDSPINMTLGGFFRCEKGRRDYQIPCKKHGNADEPLCLSARNTMYISADAKLLPCLPLSSLPSHDDTPDLNKMSLIEALSDSLYIKRITTPISALLEHQKKCGGCEHKDVCGGGCRAIALIENEDNDYLGIDPATCFFFKNNYEEMIDKISKNE